MEDFKNEEDLKIKKINLNNSIIKQISLIIEKHKINDWNSHSLSIIVELEEMIHSIKKNHYFLKKNKMKLVEYFIDFFEKNREKHFEKNDLIEKYASEAFNIKLNIEFSSNRDFVSKFFRENIRDHFLDVYNDFCFISDKKGYELTFDEKKINKFREEQESSGRGKANKYKQNHNKV